MRAPADRGTPINTARRLQWAREFAAYKSGVIEQGIVDWINQFEEADHDLAGRVLDVVDFYPVSRIEAAFRDVLASLPGWHVDPASRRGVWRFCEFSTGAGTSAGEMLYRFKYAAQLEHRQFKELFIGRSEILSSGLGRDDTLVLVDDFVGTGEQAKVAFDEFFQELVASVGQVYLVTVAARREAIEAVLEHTGMQVRPAQILFPADSPINDACTHFTAQERAKLVEYGARADKRQPRGFGDCGLVLVFCHNCPNNSLPILHARSRKWNPIFPRHT